MLRGRGTARPPSRPRIWSSRTTCATSSPSRASSRRGVKGRDRAQRPRAIEALERPQGGKEAAVDRAMEIMMPEMDGLTRCPDPRGPSGRVPISASREAMRATRRRIYPTAPTNYIASRSKRQDAVADRVGCRADRRAVTNRGRPHRRERSTADGTTTSAVRGGVARRRLVADMRRFRCETCRSCSTASARSRRLHRAAGRLRCRGAAVPRPVVLRRSASRCANLRTYPSLKPGRGCSTARGGVSFAILRGKAARANLIYAPDINRGRWRWRRAASTSRADARLHRQPTTRSEALDAPRALPAA